VAAATLLPSSLPPLFCFLIVDCSLPLPQLFELAAARCRVHRAVDAPMETGERKGGVVCEPDEVVFVVIIIVVFIVIVIARCEQNSPSSRQ
jgi:hypothetical protein